MTKFTRGSYGSVSFIRTGCTVKVFENQENGDWCVLIGRNVYVGFASRRAAVLGTANLI